MCKKIIILYDGEGRGGRLARAALLCRILRIRVEIHCDGDTRRTMKKMYTERNAGISGGSCVVS